MRGLSLLVVLFISLSCWDALAAGCAPDAGPADIVIGDNSGLVTTKQVARAVSPIKVSTAVEKFTTGESVDEYLERVVCHSPKVVVAHLSMFNPGKPDRNELFEAFLTKLLAVESKPAVVVYTSQGSIIDAPPSWATGVELLSVPTSGRFMRAKDREKLCQIVAGLLQHPKCPVAAQ